MKGLLVAAIAICFFAFASGLKRPWTDWTKEKFPPSSTGPYIPERPKEWLRVRRQTNPKGSITIEGTKPLSGPDRRPSVNLDYNHKILNNGRTNVDAYGGANWRQGGPVSPHGGVKFDHSFGRKGNGFVGGFGQVQPGNNGRMSPSFGIGGGYRFRRDLESEDQEILDSLEE